ncbi:Solute carrier 2, facilitated glucose transporter member 4 [Clonorchis sinensis]|uniref:Solute carrier 2, facilitated glucose transporter member 4 n=1 Tax=Clonorchis sinensis TaxID=79923 RepID=A0A8T1MKT5_CLOSI|nr:Solute carrier 2, facilitated glucose transporter member 4 [Clonorchis sinensis]
MVLALRELGLTWTLALTVFLTCFGSSFIIGYNIAIINLPGTFIKKFLQEKILNNSTGSGIVDAEFLYAQASTAFVVAGAIGAFSSGWVAELIGRRNGLLLNHVFAIIGGIIIGPTVYAAQPALLYLGRFIVGLNSGITMGIAPMLLTEVAPRELRGAIGACNQLAITLGIAFSYVVTLSHALNTETLWPIACSLVGVPALISLLTLPFCPESPRWLFVKKNDETAARLAFARINSKESVETFLGELREEMEVAKNQPEFKFTQLFTQKDLRMPILIGCIIQVLQQLSGINAVITYSASMMQTAGVPSQYIEYCVLANGILNVLMTVVALPLLERAGRRTLLLWPTLVLAASLLFMTITVTLAKKHPDASVQQAMGILSAVLVLVYTAAFALGLGPVPSLIVSEIFRQGPRAAAYSLSQSIQWLSNLLVLFSYPSIDKRLEGYSFLPFLVIVICCWIFFFLFMPETRNRTFDEVARDLAFGNIVVGKRSATLEDRTMAVFQKDERNPNNTELVATQPLLKQNDVHTVPSLMA